MFNNLNFNKLQDKNSFSIRLVVYEDFRDGKRSGGRLKQATYFIQDSNDFVYIHTRIVKKEFAENPIKSRHQLKLIMLCIILH